MASLTFSPTTLHIVLSSSNLLQYEDALIKAGYDYLNCFDTENNTIEELSQELTNDVPMKKPHARKLTRYLFSQQHQSVVMSAPTAQDVDDGALPIADAIPIPKVLNNNPTSFDPTVVPIPVPIPIPIPVPISVPVPAITIQSNIINPIQTVPVPVPVPVKKLLNESLANQAKGESKESSLSPCPEGASALEKRVPVVQENSDDGILFSEGKWDAIYISESDIIARVEAAGNKIRKNYDSGNIYYGQMEGGQKHGYGTYTYANGNKYVGEWKNGKMHGNGTFTWASGTKYVGQMKDGNFHGQGTKTLANGTIIHSGEWVNDKPKKKGETKNFNYAVTVDPVILEKRQGSTESELPSLTRGFNEMDMIHEDVS